MKSGMVDVIASSVWWIAIAAVVFLGGLATVRADGLPAGPNMSPAGNQGMPVRPTPPATSGSCNSHAECDDQNACTTDLCVQGSCTNAPIPGCIPCDKGQTCAPLDLVFVMDTSGSMKDEAAVLCSSIASIVAQLTASGLDASTTMLGVTETPGGPFQCLTGSVLATLGGTIPGNPASCSFPNGPFPDESWGAGAAIVAGNFAWTPGSVRVIMPIGDEAPCNGSVPGGCEDPGQDRSTVTNLISVATANGVVVSPILGNGTPACVMGLAQDIAVGTGGGVFASTSPAFDLAQAIIALVEQACENAGPCDDANLCTNNDACVNGVCTGTPIPGCMTCTANSDCDDDLNCTVDQCMAGVCAHTDVNSILCTSDADCFGSTCNQDISRCECAQAASLCLVALPGNLPDEGCFGEGETIRVHVVVGPTLDAIAGGQFLVQYDPAALEFVSADPGVAGDASSPFVFEIFESVEDAVGRVFYAVGVDFASGPQPGPAVMAVLRFRPREICQNDMLCFISENPRHTRLTDMFGEMIPFEPCCSGPITLDGGPPTFLNCPESVSVPADPGEVTTTVTWPSVRAADACEGLLDIVCSGSNSNGVNVYGLIDHGGLLPLGVSTFECQAIDECGVVATCTWTVEVASTNLLDIEVQLSPTVAAGPMTRCITLELISSCSEPPVIVHVPMTFGMPMNLPGRAQATGVDIPAGQYQCVLARDEKHTLRAVASMVMTGTGFSATFEGDPTFGGHWLPGGNIDGNGAVDVLDFGFFMVDYLSAMSPNSACQLSGVHADVNGDGLVDQIDGVFIIHNFGATDAASCCPGGGASAPNVVTDVSFRELQAMGLGELSVADLNRDGRLNEADLRAFQRGAVPAAAVKKSQRRNGQ